MDPLSVAGSIAGLLAVTQSISSVISKLISSKRNSWKEIQEVKDAVDTIRSVLEQLQQLLLRRPVIDPQRTSLIMVDQIVVSLAACVTTFSDLDTFVHGLDSEQRLGILDTIRWEVKAPEVRDLMRKLETHKTSLTLMMSILTCHSTLAAQDSASELVILMRRILESHDSLAARLQYPESSLSVPTRDRKNGIAQSIFSSESHCSSPDPAAGMEPIDPSVDPASSFTHSKETIRGQPELESSSMFTRESIKSSSDVDSTIVRGEIPQFTATVFTFEEELKNSWVYQRAVIRGPGAFSISIAMSSEQTVSWSMLSGLSLSCVSNIAIQALPIYAGDLSNSEFYQFGEIIQKDLTHVPIFGTPLNRIPAAGLAGIRLGSSHVYHIPFVVLECGEFLGRQWAAQNSDLDSLFLKRGGWEKVERLRKKFDSELMGTVVSFDGHIKLEFPGTKKIYRDVAMALEGNSIYLDEDPYNVATCLHKFLSLLNEPIIPFKSYRGFMSARQTRKEEYLEQLSICISSLPQLNQDILLYLLAMIAKLATPTTLQPLASLFQPCILRETWAGEKEAKSIEVISFMILWAKDVVETVHQNPSQISSIDGIGEDFGVKAVAMT